MNEELNRLAASFSATIREQGQQMEQGLRTLSAALDQAAARLAAVMPGGAGSPIPAAAAAAPAPAGIGAAGGIISVRVVNESSSPVPVVMINAPAASDQGRTGLIGGIASGIGNFFGSLIGGIFGGIAMPFVGLADLVVAVSGAITLMVQVRGLVGEIRAFANELVASIRGLIELLFRELTAAGIFPVSRLIAALLFLIDRGITLVLAHIQPIIVWAERLVEELIRWLGGYITSISNWLGAFITELGRFLSDLVAYILESVVRPAIHGIVTDVLRSLVSNVAGVLMGVVIGIGNILRDSFTWGVNLLERGFVTVVNALIGALNALIVGINRVLPGSMTIPSIGTLTAPAAVAAPDAAALMRAGIATGRPLGQALAEELFGPAPAAPRPGAPTTRPTFHAPAFHGSGPQLPDMPQPEPLLERIMGGPAAPAAAGAAGPGPLTLNGGINVQISAERVDLDNAEETARVIAAHVLEEINRLVEADRFRRGLATAAVA